MRRAIGTLMVIVTASIVSTTHAVTFDWATVGDPSNTADTEVMWTDQTTGYGSVDHIYRISKYEVTAGQYTEFLNAVAASDPYGLYNPSMWSNTYGSKIAQIGSDGSYSYQVAADHRDRPVNYVSYFDAMRFVNWLENGQGSSGTESGVYTISSGTDEVRNPDATYFIPSENQWYKAAYYKGGGTNAGYWDFAIASDTAPEYVNNSGNLSGTGTPFVEGGTDPGGYATWDGDGLPVGIGSPYWTTEVGEWENSESPYGTFDQSGNVWEWNEEVVIWGDFRSVRGGSLHFSHYGYQSSSARDYHSPTYEQGSLGFRVARILEVTPPSGDFNRDGVCDGADFLLWQQDPSVGLLSDWEANYGKVAGPVTITQSVTSPAVPEPGTLLLGCMAVSTLLAFSRRG